MALFLTEKDVNSLLTVADAIGVMEGPIREQGQGLAVNKPRSIAKTSKASVSILPAAIPSLGAMGFKTYTVSTEGARFWLMLFDDRGALLSIMESENVGRIRTAGATGIATKYMSRPDSKVAAILGTGFQAPAQLEAVCAVRPVERVLAWSRTPANVLAFCERMTKQLGIPVEPADSARHAVQAADIVTTITSAKEPILMGDWLREGTHLNLVGAMKPTVREVDDRTLERAEWLAVDDLVQSQAEAGEFISAVAAGRIDWKNVVELSDVVAAREPLRRSAHSISLFKSHGIGLWDIAAAARVYQLAVERGVGVRLPIDQDAVVLGGGDPERLKI